MAIENIMKQIASIEDEIKGVKKAYDEPPSSINTTPCFVNFVGPASIDYLSNQRKNKHTVKMQLYITKQIVPESEKDLRPFIDRTLDKFDQNLTLNGTCDYSMIVSYDPGVLEYNGQEYMGIEFDIMIMESEIRAYAK